MATVVDSRAARGGAVASPSPGGSAVSRRIVVLALAALVVGVAALLWTQAVQIRLWTQDEEYFVQLSRLLAENFPSAAWDLPVNAFDERGTQRLTILLLAWPLSVVNGETGFEIARAMMCLAFASAAIPAYLLARGVRLPFGWALAAAGLTALTPWATITGSFLSESVAYPAALWALWAAWRACVVPGLSSDVLALGVALAAGVARTNLLVLACVAPAAVALHSLIGAGGPGGIAARLRRAAGRLWREHPLFAVLLVPGLALVVMNLAGLQPGPLARISGSYLTTLEDADFSVVWPKWAGQVSRIVIGVGLVPAILGLPWIVRQIVRPTSPESSALALVAPIGFFAILFSTLYAAPEERYLMLAAPFLLLPGVVAIARGQVPAWAVALAGVLVAILVARTAWPFAGDQSKLLVDPVEAFWSRVVLSRLEAPPGAPRTAAGALVLALGALAVALTVVRRRRVVPLALAALTALLLLGQTGYVVGKRTELASGPGGLGDWTWVDRRAAGQTVGVQAEGLTNTTGFAPIWREVAFWNRDVEKIVSTGEVGVQIPRYAEAIRVGLDRRTGRLVPPAGEAVPRLMLTTVLFRQVGLAGDPVERSTYLPVELVRLRGTPRATYAWAGTDPEGWLTRESATGRLTVFPAAVEGGRPCVTLTLVAPPAGEVGHRYSVRAGRERRTGVLGTGQGRRVTVPLARGARTVTVTGAGFTDLGDGRQAAVNVGATRVAACGR